ncbi:MAG TPA: M15 family metallopeptidase [Acidimicrobiales bacterium]|nr:M15 family metallopeptidase [Acidimicrobiales bacterium]
MPRCRGQSGQTLPFVALVLVALGAASLLVGKLGGAAVLRARAVAAADTAALAGAVGDRADAEAVARSNGGSVLGFDRVGDDARVRVSVGPAVATARARPVQPEGAAGLAPALRAALARAEQLLGRPIPITSGRRSTAEQAALWANRFRNPFPVAPPGRSKHELGLAVDVPSAFLPTLVPVARQAGLCRPYPDDPVHFELCPP